MADKMFSRTVSTQQVGGGQVQKEEVRSAEVMDSDDYTLIKMAQFLWYIAHFIAIILGLRFLFLLLGANITGVVALIYQLSGVFVLPFQGIFPAARTGEFYFDSAALLGIVMYYLLVFLVLKALELFSKNPNQELA